MCLAHPERLKQQHVLTVRDEPPRGQLLDHLGLDRQLGDAAAGSVFKLGRRHRATSSAIAL